MSTTTERILGVLESGELALGRDRIQRVEIQSKGLRSRFRLYRFHSEGLCSNRDEFVAIEVEPLGSSPGLYRELELAAGELRRDGPLRLAIVVECLASVEMEARGDLLFWSAAEFFSRLVSLPVDFAERIVQSRLEVVGARAFQLAQPRSALVLHDPEDPRERLSRISDLSAYLGAWAQAEASPYPLLLVGERGTGKSWQLVSFCLEQLARAKAQPWLHGPAFPVGLRALMSGVEGAQGSGVPLANFLLNTYPGLSYLGDFPLLSAFLASGHTTICLDGFDEIDYLAPDASVALHMTAVMGMLPSSGRFLMTSRTSHFRSLENLLGLRLWSGLTVGEVFRVLSLEPIEIRYVKALVCAVDESLGARNISRRLAELSSGDDPLSRAFEVCEQHPALLGRFVERLQRSAGSHSAYELIADGIDHGLVDFNLQHGRTLDHYDTGEEGVVDLSLEVRRRIVAELAWFMAERGLDSLEINELPGKVAKWFRVEGEALIRDIRSQLVFELEGVEAPQEEGRESTSAAAGSGGVCRVRFALRMPSSQWEGRNPVSRSVTHAYFLACYLAERLRERDPFGRELDVRQRMSWLGRVPLGQIGAAFLRNNLDARDSTLIESLASESVRLTRTLANEGGLRVFSARYRYLFENLTSLGALSTRERAACDPWVGPAESVLASQEGPPGYQMVLVPAATQTELNEGAQVARPFLIGVHEVTNELFDRFICSGEEGQQWAVEAVTVAGGGGKEPISRYRAKTNEYHLYFWKKRGERFRPERGSERMPVTYVSWFAAASYCNWISSSLGRSSYFRNCGLSLGSDSHGDSCAEFGMRLPTAAEWIWTARGGHMDLQFPWQMYPYYLSHEARKELLDSEPGGEDAVARGLDGESHRRYRDQQAAVEQLLLGAGKEAQEVLYDEFSDFGVSGLMGNVKEWCEDHEPETAERTRVIIGATAFLERASFDFKYRMSLFPENTNPDVGFRLARSLSCKELEILHAREQELRTEDSDV